MQKMDAFDAIAIALRLSLSAASRHMMPVFGYFDDATINAVVAIFLLISGCNFSTFTFHC
ncbi:hypothetical protein ACLB1Q_20915 [Escherichia coli]